MTLPIPPNQDVFIADSFEQTVQSLADYLPGGRLFEGKNIEDTNIRRFLSATAYEILRAELKMQQMADEIWIQNTNLYINEWERLVGIPDTCFKDPQNQDIETRRKWVIVKLVLMNTLTADDWIFLAKYLGYDIQIQYASDNSGFPLILPFVLEESQKALAYTIIIIIKNVPYPVSGFPLVLPFTLGEDPAALLECLLNKIKPVDCRLVFVEEYV